MGGIGGVGRLERTLGRALFHKGRATQLPRYAEALPPRGEGGDVAYLDVDDSLYFWDVTLQAWTLMAAGGGGGPPHPKDIIADAANQHVEIKSAVVEFGSAINELNFQLAVPPLKFSDLVGTTMEIGANYFEVFKDDQLSRDVILKSGALGAGVPTPTGDIPRTRIMAHTVQFEHGDLQITTSADDAGGAFTRFRMGVYAGHTPSSNVGNSFEFFNEPITIDQSPPPEALGRFLMVLGRMNTGGSTFINRANFATDSANAGTSPSLIFFATAGDWFSNAFDAFKISPVSSDPQIHFENDAATRVLVEMEGFAGQTADLQQWRSPSGILTKLDNLGHMIIGGGTLHATAALQVISGSTRGLYFPTMTTSQVNTWLTAGAPSGNAVYDTNRDKLVVSELVNGARRALAQRTSWFNVKDFGAVGNGSTDDTVAIQAALDAADAKGGGVVYFPVGTYKTTSVLNGYDNIWLLGDGYDTVILLNPASNVTPLDCFLFEDAKSWGISRLRLQAGSIWTDALPANAAVHIKNCQRYMMHDFWIDGTTVDDRWTYGSYIDDDVGPALPSKNAVITSFNISHISSATGATGIKQRVAPNGWGFYYSNGTVQTQSDIGGVVFSPEGDKGIWLNGTDGTHFHNVESIDFKVCLLLDTVGAVVGSLGNSNSKFTSSSFEAEGAATARGVEIVATASSISFEACNFFGGNGANSVGLKIDANSGNAVNDLSFSDCRAHTSIVGVELDNSADTLTHGPWLFSNFKFQAGSPVFGSDVVPFHVKLVNCYNTGLDRTPHTGNIDSFSGRSALLLDDFAVGAHGWSVDGGTFSADLVTVVGHPGIGDLATGATINTRTRLSLPNRVFGVVTALFNSDEWFEETWVVRLEQTDETVVRVGSMQVADIGAGTADDPPTHGIYFERIADANWQAVCRTGAVQTKVDTGVVVDTGWHKFVIRRMKAGGGAVGTIRFVIDEDEDPASGTGATDISADIPTTIAMGANLFLNNTAAVNKIVKVDLWSLRTAHINNRF